MTWRHVKTVEVKNDPRSYEERRIADLQLCLVFPRSWPQYGRPSVEQMIEESRNEILPWEFTPDQEFLLAAEEPNGD